MIAHTQPSWILIAIGQTDAINIIRWLTNGGPVSQFTDPERVYRNAYEFETAGEDRILRSESGNVIGENWQQRFRDGRYTTEFLIDIFNASPDSKVVWAITPFIIPDLPTNAVDYYRFVSTNIGQMSYFQVARGSGGITNTPPSALTSLPSFIPATAETEGSMQVVNNLYAIGTLSTFSRSEFVIPERDELIAELIRDDSPYASEESCTEDELVRAIYELSEPDTGASPSVLEWNAKPGYGYNDSERIAFEVDNRIQGDTIITQMIARINSEEPVQQVFE